jgi:Bacterial PH domain/Short C-terminal domain
VARYADRLLADGERVRLRGRQHFLATLIEGRLAWAIFIASIVLVLLVTQLAPDTPPLVRQAFSWVGLGLMLISLAWLVYIYAQWLNQDYLITNRRVMKVEGILSKRSSDSSLEKINDAVLEQSLVGRMLGFGDLDILTANEGSVDRYRMLSQAQTFKRTMLEQKHALEQEGFQIPAPPLRAAAPMSPPAAGSPIDPSPDPASATEPVATPADAAAAAPPAPPAARRELSADEITSTLAGLADLRDRGAITLDDYEAKKQDLLARL